MRSPGTSKSLANATEPGRKEAMLGHASNSEFLFLFFLYFGDPLGVFDGLHDTILSLEHDVDKLFDLGLKDGSFKEENIIIKVDSRVKFEAYNLAVPHLIV